MRHSWMSHHPRARTATSAGISSRGLTVDDLPEIYREGYLHAIKATREEHDPVTKWEAFRDYLWTALVLVFEVEV
jgi:hypothetical protein